MTARPPEPLDASVVVSTFNRARRLSALLTALRAQTYPLDRFEVIIVNDAAGDATAAVLTRELAVKKLRLRVIERKVNGGWAVAREEGWRAAAGQVIAFTDDDCVPSPNWLAAGLRACDENPDAIVQGCTQPIPEEEERARSLTGPFTRTISVPKFDPACQTCNVFYPRPVLERVGGFDIASFSRAPGEDADLACRAIASGARAIFAEDAVVHHAVNWLGPIGKLRHAARWDMRLYVRHPEMRRAHFARGIFWKETHYRLVGALIAMPLPARWVLVRGWLTYRYLQTLWARGKLNGGGPLLAPYYALYDLVELLTVLRCAIRYRSPML